MSDTAIKVTDKVSVSSKLAVGTFPAVIEHVSIPVARTTSTPRAGRSRRVRATSRKCAADPHLANVTGAVT